MLVLVGHGFDWSTTNEGNSELAFANCPNLRTIKWYGWGGTNRVTATGTWKQTKPSAGTNTYTGYVPFNTSLGASKSSWNYEYVRVD